MMDFEWDAGKAESNLKKHGVSFEDAASVLGDPFAITFFDPDHSVDEDRYVTIGTSRDGRLMILSHMDRNGNVRIISAREATRRERRLYEEDDCMSATEDELRPEYDEAVLKGGVRGKYAKRFAGGTNLVRIDPDLAATFTDEQAVNDVLRWVLTLPGAVERFTKRSG